MVWSSSRLSWGVLDVSQIPSSITAHAPGYIDRENEIIVGLQTEAPLKRALMPNSGFRLVVNALEAYGYEPDPQVVETFSKYRKTHNDAVFDAYTADVRRCRSSPILTGLPDAYGRGRIIGDYRGVALYGVKRLIERKQEEKSDVDLLQSTDDVIRDREELAEQIRALKELHERPIPQVGTENLLGWGETKDSPLPVVNDRATSSGGRVPHWGSGAAITSTLRRNGAGRISLST